MKFVALVLARIFSGGAAWGPDGHTIVAHIADFFLSAEIAEILRSDLYNISLNNVSDWNDIYCHTDAGRWSAALHYIDYQGKSCGFDWGTDCKDDRCSVGAIVNYTKQVFDRSTSKADRFFALKFLVHLVGDLHQPLHVSSGDDKGGNLIKLGKPAFSKKFEPVNSGNLHSVWDFTMVVEDINELGNDPDQSEQKPPSALPYHDWQVLADLLEKRINGEWKWQKSAWQETVAGSRDEVLQRAALSTVARESAELACKYAYNYANGSAVQYGDVLQRDYYLRARPIIEEQLAKGGVRLAQLLEEALAQSRAKEMVIFA